MRPSGPLAIVQQLSDLNYLVTTPDRRKSTQLCHINMLQPYFPHSNGMGSVGEAKPVALVASLGVVSSPSLGDEGGQVNVPDDCDARQSEKFRVTE